MQNLTYQIILEDMNNNSNKKNLNQKNTLTSKKDFLKI